MARITLTLTEEQMKKIKKATGVAVKKLRLVQPTKAEETKAMRRQALPKTAMRRQALPKTALRGGPKLAAGPIFEGVPITSTLTPVIK